MSRFGYIAVMMLSVTACGDDGPEAEDGSVDTTTTDESPVDSAGSDTQTNPDSIDRDIPAVGPDTVGMANACANPSDMAGIEREYLVDGEMGDVIDAAIQTSRECGAATGVGNLDPFLECFSPGFRVATESSISSACGNCYGEAMYCAAVSRCISSCVLGSRDCDTCLCENNCIRQLESCGGISTGLCE